ncbi:MAG: hypothetical protein RLZZ630_915, partial [Bacteroidota bacterium]
ARSKDESFHGGRERSSERKREMQTSRSYDKSDRKPSTERPGANKSAPVKPGRKDKYKARW